MLSGSCAGCAEKWRLSLGWSQPPVSCSPKQPPINVSVCHTHGPDIHSHHESGFRQPRTGSRMAEAQRFEGLLQR